MLTPWRYGVFITSYSAAIDPATGEITESLGLEARHPLQPVGRFTFGPFVRKG